MGIYYCTEYCTYLNILLYRVLYITPQLRHKEAGAFLANVSIKALFERLPHFEGTIENLTPEKVKEVFYEFRKDAISMGIHWKLWPLLYRKIKGMSPHIKTIANTCQQHPKWTELLQMTGSFWCDTLSQLSRRDMKHGDKRNEIMRIILE